MHGEAHLVPAHRRSKPAPLEWLGLDESGLDQDCSAASTPELSSSRCKPVLRWEVDGEVLPEIFHIADGSCTHALGMPKPNMPISILEGKLYLMTAQHDPVATRGVRYFTMDKVMAYMPFCSDFGPFNLGMTHHFMHVLKSLFDAPNLQNEKIIYYTSTAAVNVTNSIFLLGSFLVTHMGATPDEAWAPFCNLGGMVRPYRDATWVPSPYDLHVTECWRGLAKATATGLYHPANFDEEEYFYYDHPANGDMHEVVRGKFFAFKGPRDKNANDTHRGYSVLAPSDYYDVFKSMGITGIVRLNNAEYDCKEVIKHGFDHFDLFFTDCSSPSDQIVDSFLRISEAQEGALAIHCLAGLGRTGTLIAMYMMKHMHFTADECIGWLRIVRPGSIIGPQQKYLKTQQARMWALDPSTPGLGDFSAHTSQHLCQTHRANQRDTPLHPLNSSAELAEMVTKGMLLREVGRRCRVLDVHLPQVLDAFPAAASAPCSPTLQSTSSSPTFRRRASSPITHARLALSSIHAQSASSLGTRQKPLDIQVSVQSATSSHATCADLEVRGRREGGAPFAARKLILPRI